VTRQRLAFILPALVVLLAGAAFAYVQFGGDPAPDFALPRENGQTLRLSDYRGKSAVVLVFYRGQT